VTAHQEDELEVYAAGLAQLAGTIEWEPADYAFAVRLSMELRQNWVQKVGGLPPLIKRVAKHIQAKGMDQSAAIATAVNVVKKYCANHDLNFPGKQNVSAKTVAEGCAAVADWEAKRARSHAQSGSK
jgi:hypothetical protein